MFPKRLDHIDQDIAGAGRMWPRSGLNEAAACVECDIPLHSLIGKEAHLANPELDRMSEGEVEQGSSVPLTLSIGRDGDAVDEEMIGLPFQHRNTDNLAANLQKPDIAALYPRPVVLDCGNWNESD